MLDTLKIYVQPQESKSNHLVINFDENPQLYLTERSQRLDACGISKSPSIDTSLNFNLLLIRTRNRDILL